MQEQKMDEVMDWVKKKDWVEKKGWEARGQWRWVTDVYCPKCSHHHYCDGGDHLKKKENVEKEEKPMEKKVYDEDMNEEKEKNWKWDRQDKKKDAKDENQKGWQEYGKDWSATAWGQWTEEKAKARVLEGVLKNSILETIIAKIEAGELCNEAEREMYLGSIAK